MNSNIGDFSWGDDFPLAKLIFTLCESRDDKACSSAEKLLSNKKSSICHNLYHILK